MTVRTEIWLRDLYPSRVFEPVPLKRVSSRESLRAAMRGLGESDRREVEAWIAGDEKYGVGDRPRRVVTGGGLLDAPSSVYVPALTGREVRMGYIACPFHGDGEQRPGRGLQVYEEGWYCHGCDRGGTVIDLAAELWGIPPRGEGFKEIRRRLAGSGLRAA